MARTRKSARATTAHKPPDLTALHERAKRLTVTARKQVPLSVKVDANLYEALIEAAEARGVLLADILRDCLARGLGSQTFAAADDFEPARYTPQNGLSRPWTQYETIAAAPAIPSDPLLRAATAGGMRPQHALRQPPRTPEEPDNLDAELAGDEPPLEVAGVDS